MLPSRFNATFSVKGYSWFWPKIAVALTSKHYWLVINCGSCGTVMDLDLRVKPRDPEASVRVALRAMWNVRAATGMDVHASSPWRGIHRFEIKKEPRVGSRLERDRPVSLKGELIYRTVTR